MIQYAHDAGMVKMRHNKHMTGQRRYLMLQHSLQKTKLHRAAHNMMSPFCMGKGGRVNEVKVAAEEQRNRTAQQEEKIGKISRNESEKGKTGSRETQRERGNRWRWS